MFFYKEHKRTKKNGTFFIKERKRTECSFEKNGCPTLDKGGGGVFAWIKVVVFAWIKVESLLG